MNSVEKWKKIEKNLRELYSPEETAELLPKLQKLIDKNKSRSDSTRLLNSDTAALITYANSIEDKNSSDTPLSVLTNYLTQYEINKVLPVSHLLPFYPWDTDRGFSVIDYYMVNPDYGDWGDISQLSKESTLMFDFVANHASIENPLVQGGLISRHLSEDDPRYEDYKEYKDFVTAFSDSECPSEDDLNQLLRPRPNPVLTRYRILEKEDGVLKAVLGSLSKGEDQNLSSIGEGWVWTTFSRGEDSKGIEQTCQVDLNFANPSLFLETIKILLFYRDQGAKWIRLDAIGYIWKKIGSQSLHEPEAHLILEITKDVMELAAPEVITIAEVNEPQEKVFDYLGTEGHEESDLIYQFTHFPLMVHALHREDSSYYMEWLNTLEKPKGKQFITVLGSHDGMGLKPVRGILPEEEIDYLTQTLIDHHDALPNFASLPGGKKIVYEICATPWNLVNPVGSTEPGSAQLDRYILLLTLSTLVKGVPAIYINGLIGALNYNPPEGLDENRTINRQVHQREELFAALKDPASQASIVQNRIKEVLSIRAQHQEFSPTAPTAVPIESGNRRVISGSVTTDDGSSMIYVVGNLSTEKQSIELVDHSEMYGVDLLNNDKRVPLKEVILEPYQSSWIKVSNS